MGVAPPLTILATGASWGDDIVWDGDVPLVAVGKQLPAGVEAVALDERAERQNSLVRVRDVEVRIEAIDGTPVGDIKPVLR